MKKRSLAGILACILVFGAFALGSGSDSSSRDSVTISEEGEVSNNDEESSDASAAESDEISYEISDTSFEYYTNSIGSVNYFGYVEITNTGDNDIYMEKCTFDLEDNDGHLLQSDDFISHAPEVIAPGEKGYFFNGLGSDVIDEGVSLDNGIQLTPQIKLSKATGKPHSYPVSDMDIKEDGLGYVKVTGRVENDTEEDASIISLCFIFYDENGKAIALSNSSVSDVAAGGKGSFDASTMFANDNLNINNIAETVVIAEDYYIQL